MGKPPQPPTPRCTTPKVGLLYGVDPQNARSSGLVGESSALRVVLDAIARVAAGPGDALVTGEPGSGKRTVARSIHEAGGAAVVVPIGHSLPAVLGQESSGLTAGLTDGTLLVDDLAAVGAEVQAELLRHTDRPFPRLRLIATIAIPPARAIEQGWLRRNLFERLGAQTIEMPPLRERKEDIPALVEHFLDSFCHRRCGCIFGASEAALEALVEHDWPGNVRELRDVIQRAVTTGTSAWIEPADLPPPLSTEAPASAEPSDAPFVTLAEAEANLIRMALERADGNKSLAAQMLGISRHKLYDRLRRLPLTSRAFQPSEPDPRRK